MILRIARHECRMIWRDHRFRWIGGMLCLLLSIAVLVGFQIYARRAVATEAAARQQRDEWLHKSVVNAHVAAHSGTTLFRPLHPLAALDSGVDDFVGTSIFLEPHRRGLFSHAAAEQSTVAGQFTELTAAFTLQTLVPLLIVLLTFSAFASEREQGTLRMLLSLGIRPRDLALGKALGLTAPVLLLVIPAMLIGLVALQARHALDFSRGVLLIGAYLTYFFVFVGVGLIVSARSRSSQRALIALLGFWVIACFLAPRAAFAIAQRAYPAPTPHEFIADLERIDAMEGVGFLQQRASIERRLLQQYRVQSAAELPVSTWGVTLYEREVESTKRYNEQYARLFEAYERQQHLVDAVSLAFPPLAMRTVSMTLAGTDHRHYRHFAEATEGYRYTLVQTMNQVAIESRLYNSTASFADGPDGPAFPEGEAAAYERVPAFSYRMPSGWWALSRVGLPALSLAAWATIVAAGLVRAMRHVHVD